MLLRIRSEEKAAEEESVSEFAGRKRCRLFPKRILPRHPKRFLFSRLTLTEILDETLGMLAVSRGFLCDALIMGSL